MNSKLEALKYGLALWRAPKLGAAKYAILKQRYPELSELFTLRAAQRAKCGIQEPLLSYLAKPDWSGVERDLQWLEGENCSVVQLDDADYPLLLKEITSPPPLLFVKGQLSHLNSLHLAMVGSRKPTPAGAEIAYEFAKRLASMGFTICSGLALGIDAASHEGALAANQATIAVLGTGIDKVYPRQHHALTQRIVEQGALLSFFPTGVHPAAAHFPRRNRVISGLSVGTLVVEATQRSGSLITAQQALEQGREVLAIPGSIRNPQSLGCHHLIQQGAKLVGRVEDVLEEFEHLLASTQSSSKTTKSKEKVLREDLIHQIGYEITSIEALIAHTGLPFGAIMTKLLDLEIAKQIQAVPGGYIRTK